MDLDRSFVVSDKWQDAAAAHNADLLNDLGYYHYQRGNWTTADALYLFPPFTT